MLPNYQNLSPYTSSMKDDTNGSHTNMFESRLQATNDVRQRARDDATAAFLTSLPPTNWDQAYFQDLELHGFASFTKGLRHNDLGLVDPDAYDSMLVAIDARNRVALECVLLGGRKRLLENPLNAFAHQLIGDDAHGSRIAPPPSFRSRNTAVDMVERFWMALCRDIRFDHYAFNELIAAACEDLNNVGFEQEFGFVCTPATLFRGHYEGCMTGPYLSQFLIQDFLDGNQRRHQRRRYPKENLDYLTDFGTWRKINNGDINPVGTNIFQGDRYITTLRDAGQTVRTSSIHPSHLWPTVLLLEKYAKMATANPYNSDLITTSESISSLGSTEVATHASLAGLHSMKHAWFQKWCVHRRLRPDAYAHRLELFRRGDLRGEVNSSSHVLFESERFTEVFGDGAEVWKQTQVLDRIFEHNKKQNFILNRGDREGSWLLPLAFPEGSSACPAYPSGHATFIAAAVTVAKAFFADGEFSHPRVPADNGQILDDWLEEPLTIYGELNKLVANITLFCGSAGANWRSDGLAVMPNASTGYDKSELVTGGNLLGEKVALSILRDLRQTYAEPVRPFAFPGLENQPIQVS